MKRSRFKEEQIVGILKEQEAGAKTADVCRKLAIWVIEEQSQDENRQRLAGLVRQFRPSRYPRRLPAMRGRKQIELWSAPRFTGQVG